MSLFVPPAARATDANNLPLSGAQWFFYLSGGTSPATVYADSTLATPFGTSVTADAGGLFTPIFLDPAVTYRAILKDALGTSILDIDPIEDGVNAFAADLSASSGSSLVGFIQSSGTARTVQAKLRDTLSLKDFGALCDGVTDDHAAWAAAATAARGKRLLVPDGNSLINTDGGTITLEEIEICGEGVLDGATGTIDQGAMIWITGTTNSPFNIRRGVSIKGVGFYYPNQTDSATPTVYPTTLVFDFTNGAVQFVQIKRCVAYNAYKFIDVDNGSTGAVGHIEIADNYICALNRSIYIRHNTEHFRIERNNFTFGHWLAATEAGARAYTRLNATAIKIDQSDGVEICDNLIFGQLNGLLLAATALCQFMKFNDNKFDQVRYGIKASGTGNLEAQILSNTFNAFNSQDHTLQGRSIDIQTTGTGTENITIAGNHFALATEDHIYISGNSPTRRIVCGLNHYQSWAAYKAAGTYGAINANGSLTNVQVSGGLFYGGNSTTYSYGIMGTFNNLGCSGAAFDSCQRPLSVTLSSLTGAGNASFSTGHTVSDVYTATTRAWGPNSFDKPQDVTPVTLTIGTVGTYANDAAAAGGGVPIGGIYRNGSALQVRVS